MNSGFKQKFINIVIIISNISIKIKLLHHKNSKNNREKRRDIISTKFNKNVFKLSHQFTNFKQKNYKFRKLSNRLKLFTLTKVTLVSWSKILEVMHELLNFEN